jgi:broad specificity phosphatase PhoE
MGEAARIEPGAIIIARHGRPDMDRLMRVDWRGFRSWWQDYDAAGLVPNEGPPPGLVHAVKDVDIAYSSTLRRAIETAKACLPADKALTQDPVFVEAPLPPPRIPGKNSAKIWAAYARAAWWMGNAKEMESRSQAELRAEAAVATLTAHALRGEKVALFAHGWFNRMMRPVLLSQGWRCARDGGDDYWSYRIYLKSV